MTSSMKVYRQLVGDRFIADCPYCTWQSDPQPDPVDAFNIGMIHAESCERA